MRASLPVCAWAGYAPLSVLATLVTFVLAGVGFSSASPLKANAGVIQRLAVASGLGRVAMRAVRLLRVA